MDLRTYVSVALAVTVDTTISPQATIRKQILKYCFLILALSSGQNTLPGRLMDSASLAKLLLAVQHAIVWI